MQIKKKKSNCVVIKPELDPVENPISYYLAGAPGVKAGKLGT